jgi:hypothetical protein
MALVPVDSPHTSHADEVAAVLVRAGLHPEHDRQPLQAVKGKSFAKTTIYVPETEAGRARELLAEWYAERNTQVAAVTSHLWSGLAGPFAVAIALGALAALAAGQLGPGLLVAFLSFIPLVGWWHRRQQ